MGNEAKIIDAYREDQVDRGLSATSVDCRCNRTLRSLARWVSPRTIFDTSPDDITEWLRDRDAGVPRGRLAPRTRYWHLSNLGCFFRWATEAGHTDNDPTSTYVRPRLPHLLPRPLRNVDLDRALPKADPRMKAWLLLAGYCGLRAKEIAGLRREDIDDSTSPVVVAVRHGKGDRERIVPLHPHTLGALRDYEMPSSGWVFPGQHGHMRPHSVSSFAASFLRSAGVDGGCLHRLRHYYATELYRISKDILLCKEMLGHANVATTLIYIGFDRSTAAAAVAQIGRASPMQLQFVDA